MRILVFANTYAHVSGGDVIFAEMCKVWKEAGQDIEVITNEKGYLFCKDRGLKTKITVWKASRADDFGVFMAELYKSIVSGVRPLFLKRESPEIIFSSSFFWPDIFSAVITKIKHPKAKLVVGVYLLFPRPLRKVKYDGGLLKAVLLYASQLISLYLVDRFADVVLTASRHKKELLHNNKQLNDKTVVAIRGGVDIKSIIRVKHQTKKFDCVYFGRFHSQKGIFDLLDIWKTVLEKRPKSKLLLAGGGQLEEEIIKHVKDLGTQSSVTISGQVSGSKKYRLLKSTKVFASASRFDTGNIALDEVLACGVPGIVYDLPHLHYDAGVVKVEIGEKDQMALAILDLLDNPKKRIKLGVEGKNFIRQYDWHKVSMKVLYLFIASPNYPR